MEYRRPIDSLESLCIDYLVKHLSVYKDDLDAIELLPLQIKDRLLHKFTSSSAFWTDVNFNEILQTLIHPMTKHIDLSLTAVDNEMLDSLKKSHNLRNVYLTGDSEVPLTRCALSSFISSLNQLHMLQIHSLTVNDDILISLSKACPALAGLDVNGCTSVTDRALNAMSHMKNLQWLTFSATQVSNKGIEKLARGPSGKLIKELRLGYCKRITSDVLHVIIQYCPNIEVLVFYNLQENENYTELYSSLQNGTLKNLKQLTWTIPW